MNIIEFFWSNNGIRQGIKGPNYNKLKYNETIKLN